MVFKQSDDSVVLVLLGKIQRRQAVLHIAKSALENMFGFGGERAARTLDLTSTLMSGTARSAFTQASFPLEQAVWRGVHLLLCKRNGGRRKRTDFHGLEFINRDM